MIAVAALFVHVRRCGMNKQQSAIEHVAELDTA